MKISDLKQEDIKVGLKIRSLIDYNCIGEIIKIDKDDDFYSWVIWPGDKQSYGGFYGNKCECEIV